LARTYKKVGYQPKGKPRKVPAIADNRDCSPQAAEDAFKLLEGRWKMVILFHLFGNKMLRFSELERAIPAVSQKMLIQQLRELERDGIVHRTVHPQVPPKVEYRLTGFGQVLRPALHALLKWAALRGQAGG